MSGTAARTGSHDRNPLQEFNEELQEAASADDPKPTVVILAALARGDRPPRWALERMEDRV